MSRTLSVALVVARSSRLPLSSALAVARVLCTVPVGAELPMSVVRSAGTAALSRGFVEGRSDLFDITSGYSVLRALGCN